MTTLHDVIRRLLIALGLLPYIWVIGIVGLAIRARETLGYWPQPAHPDPQFLPFETHFLCLWYLFEATKGSLILIPVIYFMSRFLFEARLPRWPIRAYSLGWVLVLALVFTPGINVVAWFLD